MTIKQKVFSAVRWTAGSAAAKVCLQLAQVAVLARLLAPDDYGLMAIVVVMSTFAVLLADCGVNSAYIQKQDVTREERSSLFWLNVMMGAGFAVLFVVLSPLLGWFFEDKRLTPLLMLSAAVVLLSSWGQQIRVTAEKALAFRAVVLLEVVSAFVGFSAAVITALLGWSVYSLVAGSIFTTLSGTILAWFFLAEGWRPLPRFRIEDVRPYLGFGGAMVGANMINQLTMSIDLLIGGRLLTVSQLGLYSVPRNLVLQIQFLINPIITRVGFPLISKVQHDVERVRDIYLKTLNMTASVNAPLYVGAAFFSPELVHMLLGHKWSESAQFLTILAIWGFFRSTANPVGSLLFGMGKARRALGWNLVLLLTLPPVLWVGSMYGPEGLAWALLLSGAMMFIPGWYFLVHPLCGASLSDYSVAALRPLLVSFASVAPAYLLVANLDSPVARLAMGILIAGALYSALCFIWNRAWFDSMRELTWPARAASR